jgi:peptidyl-prolyl cis-trans isomerase B (cyclophilin B)
MWKIVVRFLCLAAFCAMFQSPSRLQAAEKKVKPSRAIAVIKMADGGVIKFKFYPKEAPKTVDNFIALAAKGFYNGLTFHRVEQDVLIQGGDPAGNGQGGPGYTIKAEFNKHKHLPGTVAMARTPDPNSAGSQFYICLTNLPQLDGNYTIFGELTEGLDVAKRVRKGDVMKDVTIEDKSAPKKK